jgi:hypothetical protein
VLQLLVIANVASCSPILSTLNIEVAFSSETSILTRSTRRHIEENGILNMAEGNERIPRNGRDNDPYVLLELDK